MKCNPDKEMFRDKKFTGSKVTNKSGKVTSLKITAYTIDHVYMVR